MADPARNSPQHRRSQPPYETLSGRGHAKDPRCPSRRQKNNGCIGRQIDAGRPVLQSLASFQRHMTNERPELTTKVFDASKKPAHLHRGSCQALASSALARLSQFDR